MSSTDWNLKKQEYSEKQSKKTRKTIATILGAIGILILLSQIVPLLSSFISGKVYEYRASVLAKPIPDSHKEYVSGQFAYYNPGQSYFQNLIRNANALSTSDTYTFDPETNTVKQVTINRNYNKMMKLSIAAIGINSVNLTPNVESYDEKVYNLELKTGLAHFKGTPIPGDGGNAFIYGHSAVPSFFNRHQNMSEVIFSRLEKVDIGAEVIISRDGKNLKYIVRNKKIVEPTDFTILQSRSDKETVTLMTCWPLGVPSKRLIVVAERYE